MPACRIARKLAPPNRPLGMTSDLETTLDPTLIRRALAAFSPLDLAVVAETGSTNADLLRRGDANNTTHVLLAEQQTAGRGRLARTWVSEPMGSLLVSVSLRLPRQLPELSGLSLAVGVLLAEALNRFGASATLKWPNDLWLGRRKVGGILIEVLPPASQHCRVVIGFGLNIRLSAAAREAAAQPVTDLREAGLSATRTELAAALLSALLNGLCVFADSGFAPFQPRFAALDALFGQRVQLGGSETGIMMGVDSSGRLLLEQAGHVRAFEAGELSVRQYE